MRGKKIVFTIFGFLLIGGFIFTLLSSYNIKPVEADSLCPSYMNPDSLQCLYYLQEQAAQIDKQKTKVQKQLKDIEYQKLSLEEKIEYTGNLIAQMENDIKKLQLEISATDIEIGMLEKDIKEKEDDLSTLKQEIVVLSDTVSERITESYKYSFLDSIAVFLDFQNAPAILRRIKYLEVTRERDKAVLGEHTEKTSILEKEEERLNDTRGELQDKRDLVENERVELGEQKLSLDAQKRERESLLAQAKAREAKLAAEMNELMKKSNAVTAQLTALAMSQFQSGIIPANTPVKGGETILGFQGHTGYSYGSHLHLEVSQNGVRKSPFTLGYFSNSGGRIYSNAAHVPLGNGAILTQDFRSGHNAIDMIGGWTGGTYTVKEGEVCCKGSFAWMGCIEAGTYNLNGEGTPVRPIKDGKVTQVLTDPCGGKYVIVDHGNGETSMYLHLR